MNKSILEIEAEKCRSVPTARGKAEGILSRMNGMLQRPFFEVCADKRYDKLNDELHVLGWLGMIKTFTRRGGKFYAQLKLIDPTSKEAQALM